MQKSFFILINLFFLIQTDAFAQNVIYHGGLEEDIANAIVMHNNQYYLLGTTRETAKSATNYYVVQLNKNGSKKSEFIFGNIHRDTGKDVIVNENGMFILGKTWDGGFPNNDMTLTKLDVTGNQLWKNYYGGTHNDLGHGFNVTSDGGFVMVGFNRSVDDFGDVYIVKTDNSGAVIWENHFGGKYVDHGFDVLENENGEFIIAGTMGGFYNPTSTDYLNHDADIFVIKTNSKGQKIWSQTYGGKSHDWAKKVINAPEGGYYICGSTQSEGAGSFDMFIMRIDEEGNELWMKTFGGTDWEYGETIQLSAEGHLFLLGTSSSYSGKFKSDHFLVKTDQQGEEIWSKTYGGLGSDYSSDLVCTSDSGCAFTGWTDLGNIGKKDIVFYKISKEGVQETISNISPLNDSIEQIKVYPNPVTNRFSVFIATSLSNNFTIKIHNIKGETVFEDTVQPNVEISQSADLHAGIYFISFVSNKKVVFSKKLLFR